VLDDTLRVIAPFVILLFLEIFGLWMFIYIFFFYLSNWVGGF